MAGDTVSFMLHNRELARILTTREMTAAMRRHAQAGLVWAQAEARRRAFDTGEYASSFELREEVVKVNGVNRSAVVLVNADPKAWAVEWGKGGHHIMAQAVDVMKKGAR